MDEIGEAIRAARKARKLSQAALASQLGMSRATLSGLENGSLDDLGIRKVITLCSVLGLRLHAVARTAGSISAGLLATHGLQDGRQAETGDHSDRLPLQQHSNPDHPECELERDFWRQAIDVAGLGGSPDSTAVAVTSLLPAPVDDETGWRQLAACLQERVEPMYWLPVIQTLFAWRVLWSAVGQGTCGWRELYCSVDETGQLRLLAGDLSHLPVYHDAALMLSSPRKSLLVFARRDCLLPAPLARDVIAGVAGALQSVLPAMLRRAMADPASAEYLRALKSRWQQGIASLLR